MNPLKIAVIGCGGHAQSHFRMIANEPRLELTAIAELNEQRRAQNLAEHQPTHSYIDYREMLNAGGLDVVHVATMPGPIKPIVLDCLAAGLHVSVEKPPGMSAAQTAQMAEVANRSQGKNIVSFNRRYFPQVLRLRQLVQQRGGAVHCAATYNKPITRLGPADPSGMTPDPLLCDAIHHVDLIRWLAGSTPEQAAKPVAVYAYINDGPRTGAHRHNAVVHFDSGTSAVLMSHYGVGTRIQRAEVHAEDFSAYLDLTSGPQVERFEAAAVAELDLEPVGGPDFNETRHFVDCILADRTPWSTLDDAVITMQLCEAIRRGHKGELP
jgi:predicted dehydrogenase